MIFSSGEGFTFIGDKMAIFYESLCGYATREHRNNADLIGSEKLVALISSLCNLEAHWPPVSNAGETDKAINNYHCDIVPYMIISQLRCLICSV